MLKASGSFIRQEVKIRIGEESEDLFHDTVHNTTPPPPISVVEPEPVLVGRSRSRCEGPAPP